MKKSKSVPLPHTFRAVGMDWDIVASPIPPQMSSSYKGLTEWEENRVTLMDREDSPHQRRTLLHELIHIASDQGNLNIKEYQVVVLENNLWAILVDNPKLAAYIFQSDLS